MSEEQATYKAAATAPAAPQRPAGQTLTPRARALAERRFLEQLRESANVAASCRAAGIARKTAYAWRDADADFAARWDDALEDACDKLEAGALLRALDGSEGMITFLLKAHRPEKYRDQVTRHQVNGDARLRIEWTRDWRHGGVDPVDEPSPAQLAEPAVVTEAMGGALDTGAILRDVLATLPAHETDNLTPEKRTAPPPAPASSPAPSTTPTPAASAQQRDLTRDPVAAAAAALFTSTPVAGAMPPPRPEGGPTLMAENATPWTIFEGYARR